MKQLIIGLLVLFLLSTSVACAKETAPAPTPAPSPHPSPAPRLAKFIQMKADFGKDTYMPGGKISIQLSFTNITSEPYEIAPFPPLVEVRAAGMRDRVVRSFPAGSTAVTIQAGEVAGYTLVWDQQDEQGQQVPYGYYDFSIPGGGTLEDKAIVGGIHILPAEGVIEQTINVDKSQTVGGITITLNRVELTASGPRFYAFNADYSMPENPLPEPLPYAEYHLDDGPAIEGDRVGTIGGGSNLDGQEYVWVMSIPVPKDTKELTFAITEFGGQEGTWEFKIPLPEPSSTPASVPPPTLTPPRTLAPPGRLDVVAVSDRNTYLPGEPVTIEFSFINISSEPIVLSPDPPKMEIKLPGREGVVQSLAPGTGEVNLEPGENITYTLVWDQRDSSRQQVAPGYYNTNIMARNMGINGTVAGGIGAAVRVLIQCPQGAMEKAIKLNQSQTVNGLTITLESVGLTSTATRFHAFVIPPDYSPPEGEDAELPPHRIPYLNDLRPVHATYTVDGVTKDARSADLDIRGDGIILAWAHPFDPLDPVPGDAKELIFTIPRFGDWKEPWEGPWEFRVPLE